MVSGRIVRLQRANTRIGGTVLVTDMGTNARKASLVGKTIPFTGTEDSASKFKEGIEIIGTVKQADGCWVMRSVKIKSKR